MPRSSLHNATSTRGAADDEVAELHRQPEDPVQPTREIVEHAEDTHLGRMDDRMSRPEDREHEHQCPRAGEEDRREDDGVTVYASAASSVSVDGAK